MSKLDPVYSAVKNQNQTLDDLVATNDMVLCDGVNTSVCGAANYEDVSTDRV